MSRYHAFFCFCLSLFLLFFVILRAIHENLLKHTQEERLVINFFFFFFFFFVTHMQSLTGTGALFSTRMIKSECEAFILS